MPCSAWLIVSATTLKKSRRELNLFSVNYRSAVEHFRVLLIKKRYSFGKHGHLAYLSRAVLCTSSILFPARWALRGQRTTRVTNMLLGGPLSNTNEPKGAEKLAKIGVSSAMTTTQQMKRTTATEAEESLGPIISMERISSSRTDGMLLSANIYAVRIPSRSAVTNRYPIFFQI